MNHTRKTAYSSRPTATAAGGVPLSKKIGGVDTLREGACQSARHNAEGLPAGIPKDWRLRRNDLQQNAP